MNDSKFIWIIWKGEEKKVSLQGDGFSAVLHFKPEYCKKPIKIRKELELVLKKKLADALITKKLIIFQTEAEIFKSEEKEDLEKDKKEIEKKKKEDLEKDLKNIPEPDTKENKITTTKIKGKEL